MAELQALLVERALAPHERDFNLDVLYGPETDARQLLAILAGFPMMAPRRIVIVREFDKLSDNRLLKAYVESPNPQTVFVAIVQGKPHLSAHPYRALKERALVCTFDRMAQRQLPGWVERRLSGLGRAIEPRALQMLVDTATGGLSSLATEVDKLVTYAGDRTSLTVNDVIHASGQTREHNVFELQNLVGERQFEGAIRIAERLLQHATSATGEALRIHAVLSRYVTRLWILAAATAQGKRGDALATAADLKQFQLREYLHVLNRWGPHEFERAFAALLAADFELKGGSSRSAELIVLLMFHSMIGIATPKRAAA